MKKRTSVPSVRSVRSLKGKRVLVRIDANVPLYNGIVFDTTRLQAVLPTIQFLQKKGAVIILLSHLGRPEGKIVPELSLLPVASTLERLVKKPVTFISCTWSQSKEERAVMMHAFTTAKPGSIFLCENIRFTPHEEKGSLRFGTYLASFGDLYVNDGFAVAHRSDTSVALLPTLLPSVAGFLLEKEITGLDRLIKGKEQPFVALLGGIKLETKIPLLMSLLKTSDAILLGGGIANTCLASLGYGVGQSIVDTSYARVAKIIASKRQVLLPFDVIVGDKEGMHKRIVSVPEMPSVLAEANEGIYDIGPKTIATYKALLAEGKKIVWNGAMGYFEKPLYAAGTQAVARAVASGKKTGRFVVAGGGETVQAIAAIRKEKAVTLLSTGGGAMLSYIAGEKLPGIEALRTPRTKKGKKS